MVGLLGKAEEFVVTIGMEREDGRTVEIHECYNIQSDVIRTGRHQFVCICLHVHLLRKNRVQFSNILHD